MATKIRIATGLLVIAAALVGFAALSAPSTEAHPGHIQKKLFEGRWHYEPNGDYESWMNLSTSDLWINCGNALACYTRWIGNFSDSTDDWNGQPTTVDFDWSEGDYDPYYDINVVIEDNLGDPGLLGIGPSFDENENVCFGACDVWYGVVWLSDQSHAGPYGTVNSRTATTTHELGHLLQLRHESVNADESVLYECGQDNTGAIPHSVMGYDCVDPVAVGGAGEYWAQPFDSCGVNHASFDPEFGYAGCDGTLNTPTGTPPPTNTPTPTNTPAPTNTATPTQTPAPSDAPTTTATPSGTNTPPPQASVTPTPSSVQSPPPGETETPTPTPAGVARVWGDINCSSASDPVDSLLILRFDAGLAVNVPANCPHPSDMADIGTEVAWADVDCSGMPDPVDSLKVLRKDSGLTVNQPNGCPGIGTTVNVVELG